MTIDITAPAMHESPRFSYARCIETSTRIRWDIDRHVLRGRAFDFGKKFMPDALSKVHTIGFLTPAERIFLSQVQGRTYANMFALVERFIGAKLMEMGREHALGDQLALEALVRVTDEELKHQRLFRLLERMAAVDMPPGYRFVPDPDRVAQNVLSKSTWAVMGLTLDIELFSQAHYRSSIEPDDALSDLWKDVFRFHWQEESQHAIVDELEWRRIDAGLDEDARNRGVDDLGDLVLAIDATLQAQAHADAGYFVEHAGRRFSSDMVQAIETTVLRAYRWQYIVSGLEEPRFAEVLASLASPQQLVRLVNRVAPIVRAVLS